MLGKWMADNFLEGGFGMTVGLGLGGRLAGSGYLGLSGYTYILFFTDGGEKTSPGSFGKELGIVTVSNMSSCERRWRFRYC